MTRSSGGIELVRMRCRDCSFPWARTRHASRACPFCGSEATLAADEVLPAITRRRAWLFTGEREFRTRAAGS